MEMSTHHENIERSRKWRKITKMTKDHGYDERSRRCWGGDWKIPTCLGTCESFYRRMIRNEQNGLQRRQIGRTDARTNTIHDHTVRQRQWTWDTWFDKIYARTQVRTQAFTHTRCAETAGPTARVCQATMSKLHKTDSNDLGISIQNRAHKKEKNDMQSFSARLHNVHQSDNIAEGRHEKVIGSQGGHVLRTI